MKEVCKCPICGSDDCVEVVRGYEGNPVPFFKCKHCFKETKKEIKNN
jgi:transposase-like protein